MPNLLQGTTPQPYGYSMRKVTLPVKAAAQIFEGAMVAQVAGACVAATTASAGQVVGIAEHDMLGGASDGTKRISVLTDCIFIFKNGVAAFTDATPYGALAYAEDDNSVGVGGLGATQSVAGTFVGFEDDGRVRVYISESAQESASTRSQQVSGANITATGTVQRVGRVSRYLAAALGGATTTTLGTTGAVKGDFMRIVRTDTSANTLAVVNGGAGAGTLATLPVSKVGVIEAWFDGTNWLFDGGTT